MNEKQGKATLIQDRLPRYAGHSALYHVNPPMTGCEWDEEQVLFDFIVISACPSMLGRPQTCIFGADSSGDIQDWTELDGSYRGGLSHERALANVGYVIAAPLDAANPRQRSADIRELSTERDGYIEQHHRDSAELRRLCAERDAARRERGAMRAERDALLAAGNRLRSAVNGHCRSPDDGFITQELLFAMNEWNAAAAITKATQGA